MSDDERVLVVETKLFKEVGYFQGYRPERVEYEKVFFRSGNYKFLRRGDVEDDPSYKQIIPYIALVCSLREETLVFRYRRMKLSGETRLKGKLSLGIGGHVSIEDVPAAIGGPLPYTSAVRRELNEELRLDVPWTRRGMGLVNHDETEVGRVHLGFVERIEVSLPAAYPNDEEVGEAFFSPMSLLREQYAHCEGWSQILLDNASALLIPGTTFR